MQDADRFAFDGYSFIRCPVCRALIYHWLHGGAGDGETWREIWRHLKKCDLCPTETVV